MTDADEVAGRLLDEANRIAAERIPAGRCLPSEPGLYAWFVDVEGATHLSDGAAERILAGLVYAGQAGAGFSTATLTSRIRGHHLGGGITSSTFRMTLAALLARRLHLVDVGGRRLDGDGELRLTAWMRDHLSITAVATGSRAELSRLEDEVLARLDPPFNLAGMPSTSLRLTLSARRRRPIAAR